MASDSVLADVEFLFRTLEDVHPDLYARVSRDSVRRVRDRTLTTLPSMSARAELWVELSRMVALVGDAHTSIDFPWDELQRFQRQSGAIFPFMVTLDEIGGLVIAGTPSAELSVGRGDALVSVNGRRSDSLLMAFAASFGGDDEISRQRMAARMFGPMLWANGVAAPYEIVARRSGEVEARVIRVPGAVSDAAGARQAGRVAQQGAPAGATPSNFRLRRLDDSVAYLDFFSMGGSPAEFRREIDAAFARITSDSTRALVIDLRRNGGGTSQMGDALLAHFASRPYRMNAAKDWRMSAQYRAFLKAHVRQPLRSLPLEKLHPEGRRLFRGPDGTIVRLPEVPRAPSPAFPRYAAAVCVLIGPSTFSSAMLLADAVQTYRLATTIGEPTAGDASHFGEVYRFRLPRSGFVVNVSSAHFIRASGDSSDHGPVRPDIVIRTSAADVRNGVDPVLERARDCARLDRRRTVEATPDR